MAKGTHAFPAIAKSGTLALSSRDDTARALTKAASIAAGLMLAVGFAAEAQAAVLADFELNGSTSNAISNGVTLTNNGGTLGAQGITFGVDQGPTVSGLGALSAYTIDVGFTLDALNGPRGNGYVKLIDFSGLASDAGYYSYGGGYLQAYPLATSPNPVFSAGTPVRLTLSRDDAGLITAYINGSQIYQQSDPSNASATTITALPLTFFTDDYATGQGEASSGFVDYIRIADTALTPGQILPPTTGAVPEPASWAMMIVGFGMIGAGLRSHSGSKARRKLAA